MTDSIVDHRFVQVYNAYENIASSNLDNQFWSFLKNCSTIAASHICEKIVLNQDHPSQFIQGIQNLILTCTDHSTKLDVLLHTLTRLLLANSSSTKKEFQFHHVNKPIHPFIVILREKPDLYFTVLEEIEYFLEHSETIVSLKPVFKSIFLVDINLSSSALLNRLMTIRNAEIDQALSEILFMYPLYNDHQRYLELVDFFMTFNSPDVLLYHVLDRLLTTFDITYCPLYAYLTRLQQLINSVEQDEVTYDLVWAALSYLLVRVDTVKAQCMIIDLMKSLFNKQDAIVLRIAYLPLYQVLSELNDRHIKTNEELCKLKQDLLDMITYLDHSTITNLTTDDSQYKLEQLRNIAKKYKIVGLLGHFFVYLNGLYTHQAPIKPNNDTDLILSVLFTTPLIDGSLKYYSDLTQFVNRLSPRYNYKFPFLLFLLYKLRSSNAELTVLLFRDLIPSLADPKDTTITSKILQLILSTQQQSNMMSVLGIKALAHLFQIHPRVWQELKRILTDWVSQRKAASVDRFMNLTSSKTQLSIKLELAILTTMRDVCRDQPRLCCPDILPLVISLLQTCRDLSSASLTLLMTTINHCIKAGFAEPRSIWTIAVMYLAQSTGKQWMTRQLCDFYSIVGRKEDISEAFLQFKSTVLKDYLLPLLSDEEAAEYAIKSLAEFPAQDIMSVLPEKAPECVQILSEFTKGGDLVLAKLMSNELDHMRRGLFKQQDTVKTHTTEDIGRQLLEVWETGRVPPGLRSGYTMAVLQAVHQEPKWYRFMVTAFTDVTLTDHLLLRLSSIDMWESFFRRNALEEFKKDEEQVANLVKDLMVRLEKSTIPGVTCNIMLAITGLINVLRTWSPSFATSYANDMIQTLLKNYINLSSSALSHSAHLMSEEVQFAARFSLAYLAKDQDMIQPILFDKTNQKMPRNIDTALDLIQFANGYTAGRFKITDELKTLSDDSRAIGLLMGLAAADPLNKESIQFAADQLGKYLEGQVVQKGFIFGSTWVCAAAVIAATITTTTTIHDHHLNEELSHLVESAMTAASQDPNLAQHFYHFIIPYTQIQYHTFVLKKDERICEEAMKPLLSSINTDDAASHYRIASLFGLASLAGIRYVVGHDVNREQTTIPSCRQRVLLTLSDLVFKKTMGNLKSGRVAAAIYGKVLEQSILTTMNQQQQQQQHHHTNEPANYNRLNQNTSYLRAVFDQLVKSTDHTTLWRALIATPGPLPPVHWLPLLSSTSNDGLMFASVHAATSISLSEYLIMKVETEWDVSEQVLGTVLELGGLPRLEKQQQQQQQQQRRGMNAVVKRVQFSESRMLELMTALGEKFNEFDQEKQSILLDTLRNHLVCKDESKKAFIESLQQVVYETITKSLFASENKQVILCKAIQCTVNQTMASIDDKDISLLNRIVGLCECYRLLQQQSSTTVMKHIVSAMIDLISSSSIHADFTGWKVIAELIHEEPPTGILNWILRCLDAFVVYLTSSSKRKSIKESLEIGLHTILSNTILVDQDIRFADTIYLLHYYVYHTSNTKAEQEQIIKRIFKLLETATDDDTGLIYFINKILLTLPQ
ncbi:uncharacterized protein BX663DRAFT_554946 [Cokeromyces recurvatus]|uniref:uncharacterized protein n=1 Tax=Cokeromyces recurvatus TaxID=90255 RepID=UPI002220A8DA|nr:uncharacterized protein BX663DRAFT_554946 [Cokeromyces recurvatus]KAI7899540.1 hypothetical protein BX663DRAFT_554946 [Cokeromyces recurvatus]